MLKQLTLPLLFLFMFIFWNTLAFAQHILQAQLIGSTQDKDGAKLTGVTIVFVNTNDTTVVTYAGSSDRDGRFMIPIQKKGDYKLRFSLIGYQTVDSRIIKIDSNSGKQDIGVIKLPLISYLLNEVNITSKKPLISFNNNTAILNVAGRAALLGTTPLEILKLAPGVIVSNGTILLNGKSNVIILIDGKKQFFNIEQAIQFLQNNPTDNISQIEVSSTSSSKYDSEESDGVINIITKKNLTDGTKGTASFAYSQGKYARLSPGINLINSQKNTVISATYNYAYSENFTKTTNFQKELTDQAPVLNSATDKVQNGNLHIVRFGVDHALDKFRTLSFSSNANISHGSAEVNTFSRYYPSTNSLYTVSQMAYEQTNYSSLFNNLNYNAKADSGKKDFNIDLNYGLYRSRPLINYWVEKTENSTKEWDDLQDKKSSIVNIFTMNGNYIQKFRNSNSIEFGTKLSYTLSDYKVDFDTLRAERSFTNHNISTFSNYKEFIPAVYGIYKGTLKAISYDLGLRVEATLANIDFGTNEVNYNLLNYYPNINLSYKQSKTARIIFGLRKGIYRPPYLTMNPTIIYYDKFSYFQGNPNLRPSNTYGFSITQILANRYSINLGYSLIKGSIAQVYERDINTDITKITYSNINTTSSYSLNFYLPVNLFKWWEVSNNISLYYLHYLKYDKELFPDINKGNFINKISSSHMLSLPGKIYGDISFFYNSSNRFNQTYIEPYLTIDLGLKRTFYTNKFTAFIGVVDLTNQIRRTGITYYNLTISENSSKDDSRRYRITLSYRFGNAKANNSRQRRTGIEEEQNRTSTQQ